LTGLSGGAPPKTHLHTLPPTIRNTGASSTFHNSHLSTHARAFAPCRCAQLSVACTGHRQMGLDVVTTAALPLTSPVELLLQLLRGQQHKPTGSSRPAHPPHPHPHHCATAGSSAAAVSAAAAMSTAPLHVHSALCTSLQGGSCRAVKYANNCSDLQVVLKQLQLQRQLPTVAVKGAILADCCSACLTLLGQLKQLLPLVLVTTPQQQPQQQELEMAAQEEQVSQASGPVHAAMAMLRGTLQRYGACTTRCRNFNPQTVIYIYSANVQAVHVLPVCYSITPDCTIRCHAASCKCMSTRAPIHLITMHSTHNPLRAP
jgi:hypothetical protein